MDKNSTILGATSTYSPVNIKVRRPQASPAPKKRKTAEPSEPPPKQSKGTITDHYFNFLNDTMDIMDKFSDVFQNHYLVMDNAPIHTNEDIKNFVEGRGYRCVYLPPNTPELNSIE